MRRAFLVLGPESSGTRLMTQILMAAGCEGDDGDVQRWDSEALPEGEDSAIVWRRSFPHGSRWRRVHELARRCWAGGYDVKAVVTSRAWHAMVESQCAAGHVADRGLARAKIQQAYFQIHGALAWLEIHYVMVSYENLVLRKEVALGPTMRWLGLPVPKVELYDANRKWYDERTEA